MNELLKGRNFQLWEYKVSHGALLIRSPKKGDMKQNIDIKFYGVEYVSAPRHLNEISIEPPNDEDLESIEKVLGEKIPREKVSIIVSGENRYSIVSSAQMINSNELGIFDSPFE